MRGKNRNEVITLEPLSRGNGRLIPSLNLFSPRIYQEEQLMKQKKNAPKKYSNQNDLSHLDMNTANVGSSTDCTGLIPAAPGSRVEREAYKELYNYEAGVKDKL